MIELVTELPLWIDCPFQNLIPSDCLIRKGETERGELVAITFEPAGEVHFHVDCTEPVDLDTVKVMVRLLANQRLYAEFPDVYPGVIKRQAEHVINGKPMSKADSEFWARKAELYKSLQ